MTNTIGRPPVLPFTDGFAANPYPTYTWLRRNQPVYPVEFGTTGVVVWLVTRYEDVTRVLSDPQLSADPDYAPVEAHEAALVLATGTDFMRNMSATDLPEHGRLRSAVAKSFTVRQAARRDRLIHDTCERLLDEMAGSSTVDLMKDYGSRISTAVVCDLLGATDADRDEVRADIVAIGRASSDMFAVADAGRGSSGAAIRRLEGHIESVVERRRCRPGDDLLSGLVELCRRGVLTDRELKVMVFLLVGAGYEAPMNMIGNAVLALLDFPGQRALLRREPDLVEAAVEELLRYEGPTAMSSWRFTKARSVIAGVEVPANAPVTAVLASANRDETKFPRPDVLDLRRDATGHVAFGYGMHRCVASAVTRRIGRIAIPALINRFPDLELAIPRDEVRVQPEFIIRGPSLLPVRPGRSAEGHGPGSS